MLLLLLKRFFFRLFGALMVARNRWRAEAAERGRRGSPIGAVLSLTSFVSC
jgi:hypothetical protein